MLLAKKSKREYWGEGWLFSFFNKPWSWTTSREVEGSSKSFAWVNVSLSEAVLQTKSLTARGAVLLIALVDFWQNSGPRTCITSAAFTGNMFTDVLLGCLADVGKILYSSIFGNFSATPHSCKLFPILVIFLRPFLSFPCCSSNLFFRLRLFFLIGGGSGRGEVLVEIVLVDGPASLIWVVDTEMANSLGGSGICTESSKVVIFSQGKAGNAEPFSMSSTKLPTSSSLSSSASYR